jgi:hypothetical protein
MWRRVAVLLICVLPAMRCGEERRAAAPPREAQERRGAEREKPATQPFPRSTQPIDWQQSTGIFIGIEQFHPGADRPEPVAYAADDATDLAYFFAKERKVTGLLPASRTYVLLSGRPHKPQSLQRLRELREEAHVVIAEGPVCIDAAMIYSLLDRLGREVGGDGILIVSIATHGFTVGDQHVLLTSDSPVSHPRGVVVGRMMQALRESSGRRLLLLVDACRTPHDDPGIAFEDLDVPAGYAVLSAASPRRTARSEDALQNGYFTSAVIEGLRCRATAGPDAAISPRELDAYVGKRVHALTHGWQQPEGRFSGGLGDVELVNCSIRRAATLLEPHNGDHVKWRGPVRFHVLLPDLHATVFVCAESNGVCYNQNPGLLPFSTHAGRTYELRVYYGAPDTFHVWVALTADAGFLRGRNDLSPIPFDEHAERTVYWLGPVDVTFDRKKENR